MLILILLHCYLWTGVIFAAREMERVSFWLVHIPQKHQGMVPGHLLAWKLLRCGRLLLFSSRSQHYLQDAWFHQFYQSPSASPWHLIEFYSMRTSCVRLLLRISFSKIFLYFLVSMYIISSLSLYLQAVVRVCKFCSFLGSVRSYGTSGLHWDFKRFGWLLWE